MPMSRTLEIGNWKFAVRTYQHWSALHSCRDLGPAGYAFGTWAIGPLDLMPAAYCTPANLDSFHELEVDDDRASLRFVCRLCSCRFGPSAMSGRLPSSIFCLRLRESHLRAMSSPIRVHCEESYITRRCSFAIETQIQWEVCISGPTILWCLTSAVEVEHQPANLALVTLSVVVFKTLCKDWGVARA